MIGVDLFAGAGGMALGAVQAGIDVRLAIEADSYAAATYSHNHPSVRVLVGDIRKVREIKITCKGKNKILFGGPPCQGFSTSNQRTRTLDNPFNWLYLEFMRIVRLWKPDWVVFENVKGLKETEKGVFLNRLLKELFFSGYTTACWVLNAADFGVPQMRSRLFVLGSLHGNIFDKPKPTVSEYVTVRQAIDDLPDLPNGASVNLMPYKTRAWSKYAQMMRERLRESPNHLVTKNAPHIVRRYKYIPQGGNWENIPATLMKNYTDRTRCHTRIYCRLRKDEPSVVIGNYRKNMLIHPKQDRGLSVREAARLQSFPDWYEFKGSIGFQQQQVGNAVPPFLARIVFETILKCISRSGDGRSKKTYRTVG